jgi:hypothetical protein
VRSRPALGMVALTPRCSPNYWGAGPRSRGLVALRPSGLLGGVRRSGWPIRASRRPCAPRASPRRVRSTPGPLQTDEGVAVAPIPRDLAPLGGIPPGTRCRPRVRVHLGEFEAVREWQRHCTATSPPPMTKTRSAGPARSSASSKECHLHAGHSPVAIAMTMLRRPGAGARSNRRSCAHDHRVAIVVSLEVIEVLGQVPGHRAIGADDEVASQGGDEGHALSQTAIGALMAAARHSRGARSLEVVVVDASRGVMRIVGSGPGSGRAGAWPGRGDCCRGARRPACARSARPSGRSAGPRSS